MNAFLALVCLSPITALLCMAYLLAKWHRKASRAVRERDIWHGYACILEARVREARGER